jgi:hypothetical protein
MTETRLHGVLRRSVNDLSGEGVRLALVGGLAVSARVEPRFTRDLDLAIAVADDREAETIARFLRGRSYQIQAIVEQEAAGRLATVRLLAPGEAPGGIVLDLLFASSGIEPEIVRDAEPIEVAPGITVPVASRGHLIAMKVLSRDDLTRPQDIVDLRGLLAAATTGDLESARAALELIQRRGFHRGRDLLAELAGLT